MKTPSDLSWTFEDCCSPYGAEVILPFTPSAEIARAIADGTPELWIRMGICFQHPAECEILGILAET